MPRRIPAGLVYESEAAFRLLDHALDELQLDLPGDLGFDAFPIPSAIGDTGQAPALRFPSDLHLRRFWKVHELLDIVRQSRETLQQLGEHSARESRTNAELGRALALIEQLAPSAEEAYEAAEARAELELLLRAAYTPSPVLSDALATLSILIAEAEARLTRLAQLLE